LNPYERTLKLEASKELEAAHADAARKGDTAAPDSAEVEVDYHYVCFAKSRSGRLYELDGAKKGPIDREIAPQNEDLLGPAALKLIKDYIQREGSGNLNFSLMALGPLDEY
jgi:ubiquitin carboxyl-terminal hydrolase L3